ncbi:recombination protein NinB [Pasteurellaceae bacterium TAE3-ERU1]|uniref:recombination protein NinB n=1 Tax=Spirabiliibacterium mucosae TaxID=28156 RepID=UPI001AAC4A11|nr:recombination protein NinB [Spirabiliibacterium mucosae]MBE2898101.1 recombination protein NinB [Spirabiliibacterium mucosae]MBV7388973.1 recombination protein NinB [Pasteurellaceae bacterium TAE3-ERU1]
MKQRFFLRNQRIKDNAKEVLEKAPTDNENPLVLEIKPLTRTLEQNAKLHAMLTDISKQCEFQGKKHNVETWKTIMVSAHAIATGKPAEMAIGLEGEVINLRESTAQMSVKRLASLIEYVQAWGVGNGVHFNDRFGFYGY